MMRDSMEFLELYRCRLRDAGIRDTHRHVIVTEAAVVQRERTIRPRFRRVAAHALGRLLSSTGRALSALGERLAADTTRPGRVASHG